MRFIEYFELLLNPKAYKKIWFFPIFKKFILIYNIKDDEIDDLMNLLGK